MVGSKKYLVYGAVLIWLTAMLIGQPVAAQESTGTLQVSILGEPVVNFPTVTLNAGVYRDGLAVADLGVRNFQINGEDVENLNVEQIDDGVVNLGVVIDLSAGTDLGLVREVLRAYFQSETYFREGDTALFVVTKDSALQVAQYSNRDEINNFINSLSLSANNFRYSPALEALVSQFSNAQLTSGQVLLIGSFFYYVANDATPIAERASQLAQQGLPVSAIQAHAPTQRTNATAQFRTLAEQGGGGFADYTSSQNTNAVTDLFDAIQASRITYQISYETQNAESGTRQLELVAEVDDTTATSAFSYEAPEIGAPDVVILNPAPNSVIPRTQDVQNPASFLPSNQLIRVQVSFPGDLPREIVSASLIAQVGQNPEQRDDYSDIPLAGDDTLELNWDLTTVDGSVPGLLPVTLRVEVTDAYGLVGTSNPVILNIENPTVTVGNVPGQPPPVVPNNVPDTSANSGSQDAQNPAINATPVVLPDGSVVVDPAIFAATEEAARRAAEEAEADTERQQMIMAIAGGVIIFLILAMSLISRRRAASGGGGRAINPGNIRTFGDLEVIRGPYQGQLVEIDSSPFSIGREVDAGVDFATPEFGHVSARHCSIIYKDGRFVIVDHRSTNGTFIDGNKIAPDVDTPIQPQSLIRLGFDPMMSVELRFYPAQALIASSGSAFKGRTMVGGIPAAPAGPYAQPGQPTFAGGSNAAPAPYANPYANNAPPPAAPPNPYGNAPYATPPAAPQGNVWQERTQPFNPGNQNPNQPPPGGYPAAPYGQQGRSSQSDWNVNEDDQSWLDS